MASRQQSGPVRVIPGRIPAVPARVVRTITLAMIVLGVAYLVGHLFPIVAAAYFAWRYGR